MDSESGSAAKRPKMSQDVKSMSSKAFMDEYVVPVMLRALSAVNKEVQLDDTFVHTLV